MSIIFLLICKVADFLSFNHMIKPLLYHNGYLLDSYETPSNYLEEGISKILLNQVTIDHYWFSLRVLCLIDEIYTGTQKRIWKECNCSLR